SFPSTVKESYLIGSFEFSVSLAMLVFYFVFFFFSSRRRHTRWPRDWSSDVCSSDLRSIRRQLGRRLHHPFTSRRFERLSVTEHHQQRIAAVALPLGHHRSHRNACREDPLPGNWSKGPRDRKSSCRERVEI